MVNNIVTVEVSQTVAPTPATLQKTGAFISQGGTTLAPGTFAFITGGEDFNEIQNDIHANASITWSGGTATATTGAPHGMPVGQIIPIIISGAAPSGYNGVYEGTITGTSTFTYAISNPGASPAGTPGFWASYSGREVEQMVTTFFAQGASQGVYVLELGPTDAAHGVAALADYITLNPNSAYTPGATGFFYAYIVPRAWVDEDDYIDFLANYEATTAKTYFFTTVTLDNYTRMARLPFKDVFAMIEAPSVAAAVNNSGTEFTIAAPFYWMLNNKPSATNKVPPFAFTFLFGVTSYPLNGNSATLAGLLGNFINYVGTGAEGGISTAILRNGTTSDGRGMTYWYSVDWIQINVDLNISNAVINGSNNHINPLYFNQDGINRLQQVGANTLASAVSFGLANGTVVQTSLTGQEFDDQLNDGKFAGKLVINAIPFVPYNLENPGDYKIGEYDGLSCVYIDQTGFIHILFNINVTDFVAQ